jgi:DNA repair exonuclease SbcCD ATPase subunit
MIIDYIALKNIKSFGNNRQVISFNNDKPELILLTGRNGSGKSTIQESIDLAIFGKVRGKNKKNITLSSLPNRINKSLSVDIGFKNMKGQNILIKKDISPNNFEISINNISYTNRFNLMNDKEKENLIGFNHETFKSFISMSINDFLNFIQLQKVDKRNLLNKLFNLEKLDSYLSIAKDLLKNIIKSIDNIDLKISNNISTINSYTITINNSLKIEQQTKEEKEFKIKNEAGVILNKINEEKVNIKKLNEVYSETEVKIQEIKNKITILSEELKINNNSIIRIDEKIKIFESGKCPTCETSLVDHDHKIELSNFHKEKDLLNEKNIKLESQIKKLKTEGSLLLQDRTTNINNRNNKINIYNDLKNKLSILKEEYKSITTEKTNMTVEELKKTIENLKNENQELEIEKVEIKKRKDIYEKMVDLLDENGVRSEIIKSIVKPINKHVSKILSDINFNYKVVLDEEFNAKVFDRGIEEIDTETLSNGEMKIVNIVIALSYIKMIRTIKNINILFLDEVFVSLDSEYIELLLKLLKNMSSELGLNIIIIHHGMSEVDLTYFDRMIKVTKNMFTNIEDIKLK